MLREAGNSKENDLDNECRYFNTGIATLDMLTLTSEVLDLKSTVQKQLQTNKYKKIFSFDTKTLNN